MTRASRSTQSPRRTRTARGLLAVVASIAMVLTGLAAVAPAARAVDNASISGVVTDADGPVAGVLVEAIQFVPVDGDEYGDPAETATRPITGADGTYTITGLAAGQYTLSFVDGGSVSYLGGATHPSTATRIMLGAGEAKTGVDDFLDERASVSGTVTSQADVALGGIEVRLLSVVENGGAIEEDLVSEVTTSGGGAYAFTGLLPGEYTLRFHDPAGTYPDQYLGETAALQDAERFTLETGDAEVVDAALLDEDGFRDYRSGPLGSVVDAEGDPLEGATVTLYRAATTAGPFVQVAGGSIDLSPTGRVNPLSTGVDGGFGWSVLAGAVYEVRATKAGCVSALDTAAPFATSGAVEVGELDTELELALLCTAGFAGTVSSAAAAPLDGIVVEALALEEAGGVFQATVVDDTETEDGGGFDFDGLPPGDYTLRFSDPIGGTYPQQYLGGTTDLQNADRFSLVVGVTPDDIAATLLDADALRTYLGGPSGTVTAPGGAAVDGATVTLYRSASPSGPFGAVVSGSVDLSPTGRVNPVRTGVDGTFAWSVVTGYYEVRATKAGCVGTGSPARGYATSGTISPAALGTPLELRLTCTAAPAKVTTATTLALSSAKRPYGTSSSATIAVSGSATGTVVLKDGRTTIGRATLVAGKARITLSKKLGVRKHTLTASYLGSASRTASQSSAKVLTVTKAKARVRLKAKTDKLVIRVRTKGFVAGGKVLVKRGSTVLRTKKLKKGAATIKGLAPGVRVTVLYRGSSTATKAKAKIRTR